MSDDRLGSYFVFPPLSDKFSEGVATKSQWLLDYFIFREHCKDRPERQVASYDFQNSMGQNCSRLADRFRGSLLGLAIGDALGVPLEFQQRPDTPLIEGIQGGGPFGLKSGEWTDDTSMALCLAHSLLRKRHFDAKDQMDLYVKWWTSGYLSSNGVCFDIGNTVRGALERYRNSGDPMAGSIDPKSAGNGSLMRLAPAVLFFASDESDAINYAGESSKTTHGATEAIDACRLMAAIMLGAIYGESKEVILAPDYTPIRQYWDFHPLCDSIRSISRGVYKDKARDDIRSSGYVLDSLEAALWAFHKTDNFRDGALLAVNLGGDSDTIGAIYGQLAGAYYGETMIPIEWIRGLAHVHIFYLLADEFAAYYSGKPTKS